MSQTEAVFPAVDYRYLHLTLRNLDTIIPDIQHSNIWITIIL